MYSLDKIGASLGAQTIKNLLAMQEIWVWSLGWEDPLEKGMATHSSILAWRIPWTEEPNGLYIVHGVAELNTTEKLTLSLFFLGKIKKAWHCESDPSLFCFLSLSIDHLSIHLSILSLPRTWHNSHHSSYSAPLCGMNGSHTTTRDTWFKTYGSMPWKA